MRPETVPWIRQAQADLESARLLAEGGKPYATSWFAQQSAEKALKALFLEQRRTEPPRTHDLVYLGVEVHAPLVLRETLSALNRAFGTARYPEPTGGQAPVDQVTSAEAAAHLDIAERVLEWVDQQLSAGPPQP